MSRPSLLLLLLALAAGCAGPPAPRPPARPDPAAAVARCELGFSDACRIAGRAALTADGAAPDDRLAAALLTRACELGDPPACSDLAVLHALGRAVPQSDARAVALARRACDGGSAIGCSNQGALLAEGVGAPRGSDEGEDGRGEDDPGRAARLFRTACEGRVAEGCLNLGTALEGGGLADPDPDGAARAYRRACQGGLGVACHRLALLVKDRPETAPGEDPAALEARACAAGVGPACMAVNERPHAAGARAPSARLADDRRTLALGIPGTGGFFPGDLWPASVGARRRPDEVAAAPEPLQAVVPPALRARLGLDGSPRPAEPADAAMELMLALRAPDLAACDEGARAAAGPVELLVTFLVDADGRPSRVKAASDPEDEGLETCARERVEDWEFPVPPGGLAGPFLVRQPLEAAPPGPPPGFAGPGGLRPALRDAGCVDREVSVPPAHRGALAAATVRLVVDAAGRPARVRAVGPVPGPIVGAIRAAVRRCAWVPGAGPDGRPEPLWTTLTVQLAGR